MKVLYVITKGERGGAQNHLWTLMQRQRFGTPILAVGEDGLLCEQARSADIPVYAIPHLVYPINPWKDMQAVRELVALIRSEQPDLVHAHTSKAGMIARIAGFLTGTPTVYTVHGWSFLAITSPLLRSLSLWIERALSLTSHTVIDVSRFSFDVAERERVARPDHHVVIWNGVPDTPHRASFDNAGPLKMIAVARFAPQKDHPLLLDALAQLPGEWRCDFVGSGPDQEKVEAKARLLGLEEKIRFLGDRDDVAELLAESHLFVLCSHYESLPLSIMEAMRAGLPVVASDVGGCAELVTDGVTGLLARPGDAQHLQECLRRMLASKHLLESFGRAGRERFETDFQVESMVRKTVSAYSRLVTKPFSGVAAASVTTFE